MSRKLAGTGFLFQRRTSKFSNKIKFLFKFGDESLFCIFTVQKKVLNEAEKTVSFSLPGLF